MSGQIARSVVLDGNSLTCRILSDLGTKGSKLSVSKESMRRVVASRGVVDGLVDRGFKEGHVAYGINTGFGLFSDVIISHDKLAQLQVNK